MKFKNLVLFSVCLTAVSACTSVKQLAIQNDVNRLLNQNPLFSNHHTGLSIYDLSSGEYITSYHSTKKFTPASNTKLLTTYATLKTLGDSIPALLYQKTGKTCLVHPTGDPTLLSGKITSTAVYDFLSDCDSVTIQWPSHTIPPFGRGWAWDDYGYTFQTNRAVWPIYDNLITAEYQDGSWSVSPDFFEHYATVAVVKDSEKGTKRSLMYNLFEFSVVSDTATRLSMPFIYSEELFVKLLEDTLSATISISEERAPLFTDTIYSVPTDRMLAYMMKPSDNFLAEQLLLLAARERGFKNIHAFIAYAKTNWFPDLNDMVWVDGSGLSRYNLIAPVDQVRLLVKMYKEFGWDRIKEILPTGGEGTLKNLYVNEEPYIFAKTGTLSNNHNLSGYLFTNSGKLLVFSFMNNHFTGPTIDVKHEMEKLLNQIRSSY